MGFAKFVLIRIAKWVAYCAAAVLVIGIFKAFPAQTITALGVLFSAALVGFIIERAHADYKGGKKP